MKRIFKRGAREVKNGFKLVDLTWRKFNKEKEKLLTFIAGYIPKAITPNFLSVSRICLSLLLVALLFRYTAYKPWIVGLFVFCVISDIFDGPIARKRGLESQKGAFLDRLGDKLLICPLVARLAWEFDGLVVKMIVGSELLSILIAVSAIIRRVSTRSNPFGKWKMAGQATGVFILFFFPQQIAIASKVLWVALGLGLASLIGHFQSYIAKTE